MCFVSSKRLFHVSFFLDYLFSALCERMAVRPGACTGRLGTRVRQPLSLSALYLFSVQDGRQLFHAALPAHAQDAERFLPWVAIKQLAGESGAGGTMIAVQQLLLKVRGPFAAILCCCKLYFMSCCLRLWFALGRH